MNPSENSIDNYDKKDEIAAPLSEALFKSGDVIFSESDQSDYAYIIEAGQVVLTKIVDGREIELAHLEEKAIFGEMGLIDEDVRSASAKAVTDIRLTRIDRETLIERIDTDHSLALAVVQQLIINLRSTSEKFAHSQFLLIRQASEFDDSENEENVASKTNTLRAFFGAHEHLDEFRPDVLVLEERSLPASARAGLYTIAGLFVFILCWACLAVFDVSISAPASLRTEAQNIVLQPMETALIRSIDVKRGDVVSKGQILARLDQTFARADLNAGRVALNNIEARSVRLDLELRDAQATRFSPVESINSMEATLFETRRSAYKTREHALQQNIVHKEELIAVALRDVVDMQEQLEIATQVEGVHRKIAASGEGSRLNHLLAKNQLLDTQIRQRDTSSRLASLRSEFDNARAEHAAFIQERKAEIADQLVMVRAQREELYESFKKLERRARLVEIVAPQDGIVLETSPLSVGSVIQSAEQLVSLVPTGVDLQFEILISPSDIGPVNVGDPAELKLDTLPFQKHGSLFGQITMISEGTINTQQNGQSVELYKATVRIVKNNLYDLPEGFRLLPGLTASAQVNIGKRRVITYLLYPIMRGIDSSFREV